jgi:hypothetical protein
VLKELLTVERKSAEIWALRRQRRAVNGRVGIANGRSAQRRGVKRRFTVSCPSRLSSATRTRIHTVK